MKFSFTPQTDEELENANLLPEGEYTFVVKGALEKTSAAGNPMIEMTLMIHAHDGGTKDVIDWLLKSQKMAWKIKAFYLSLGLLEEYNAANADPNLFIGKQGRCHLEIEKSDKYGNKNRIKRYTRKEAQVDVLKNKSGLNASSLPPVPPPLHADAPLKTHEDSPVVQEEDDNIPF